LDIAPGPFLIQGKQPFQNLTVGKVGGPAIGGGNGGINPGVTVREP